MARSAKKAGRRRPETITQLYEKFERAEADTRAVPNMDEKLFSRKVTLAADLAAAIARAPANTVREMLLKIRVAAWDIGGQKYKRLEELDRWTPGRLSQGAGYDALASLRNDLKRLVREGNISFDQPFNADPWQSRAS